MHSTALIPWRLTPHSTYGCFSLTHTLLPSLGRRIQPLSRRNNEPNSTFVNSKPSGPTTWDIDGIVCGMRNLKGSRSIAYYCYLLRNRGTNILVDCSFSSPALINHYKVDHHRRITDQLLSLRVSPEDIQAIILTRLHPANCENLSAFPNARIYVRSAAWLRMQEMILQKHCKEQCSGLLTEYEGIAVNAFLELYRAATEHRLYALEGIDEVEIFQGISTRVEGRHLLPCQCVLVQSSQSQLYALAGDCADSCDKLDQGHVESCTCVDNTRDCYEETRKRVDVLLVSHGMELFEKHVERAPGIFAVSTTQKFFSIRELKHTDSASQRAEIDMLLRRNLPFVVRKGVFDGSSKCFDWTLEYLYGKCRTREVIVRKDTRKMDYRTGRRLPIVKMEFGDYVDEIKSAKKFSKYLAACNIKIALPAIKDDVFLPHFVEHVHKGPFLWIAPNDHYEFCHMDPDDGLLIVCTGSKDIKLFAPEYIGELYPNPLGSHGRTIQSRLPDVVETSPEFPLFDSTKGYETTLYAGDYLYIPAFYWHQVTSTKLSISINVFWGSQHFLSKLRQNAGVKAAFHYWLVNVLEQNRQVPSFARILEDLPEQIRRFLFNQWAETINDDLCGELKALLLAHLEETRSPTDSFLHKDLALLKKKAITKSAKHTQRLRIRGLMHRSGRTVVS